MKRIMVLGASYLQTFIIKKIKEMGHYCIVLDYTPNSPGFELADQHYLCSTTEREKVLELAKKEDIDGIMTYASDVAAPVVAYVAEKLGLPTNPYASVDILTDKFKMRQFMQQHNFAVPHSAEVELYEDACVEAEKIGFPVIVKPIDSSGSKGVSRVDSEGELEKAFAYAKSFSRAKKVIIETFLERSGYQIDADCFMYDGNLVYFNPMDQHQDKIAPYSPIGISAPSVLERTHAELAFHEVQRLLQLLHMKFGQYNVEYIFDKNNKLYILEIGPRSGGNLIPDVIREGTGIDICYYNVLAHIGEDCSALQAAPFSRNVTSYIIHSQEDGIFDGLEIDERVEKAIRFMKLFVTPGQLVKKFANSIDGLGFCLMEYESHDFMLDVLDHSEKYIKVKLKR